MGVQKSTAGRASGRGLPTLKWKRRATLAGTSGGRRVLVERQMVRVGARGGDERYTGGLAGQVEGVGVAIEAVLHFAPSAYPFSRLLVAGELSGEGLKQLVLNCA